jgi:hypothetical protein
MSFQEYLKESLNDVQYTVDDIEWKKEFFDEEKRDKDGDISYIKSPVINFYTKDRRYYTKPDSNGFSYWIDSNGRLGQIAYDYVFGTLIDDNIQKVVKVLNKVIS